MLQVSSNLVDKFTCHCISSLLSKKVQRPDWLRALCTIYATTTVVCSVLPSVIDWLIDWLILIINISTCLTFHLIFFQFLIFCIQNIKDLDHDSVFLVLVSGFQIFHTAGKNGGWKKHTISYCCVYYWRCHKKFWPQLCVVGFFWTRYLTAC